ncbi:aquaporin [Nostocoides australiense Ben110]|uniref:Aquaporin n=1 Tax=Nostocoides australiense Ben110 TaxID=1193182 RepID=W6JWN7_9MICO|nr:aquaporin Z [Tetrasphaera australiensis]CCH73050.1 aquaporin [Tetrasphaera australiensis Ben110]
MRTPRLPMRLGAEFLGTFWLVFGGCGSAVFAALHLGGDTGDVQLGIGFLGVALAFGLTVLTMAYAVGHVSGAHFNPAVTIGLAVGKRFEWKDVPAYVAAQVVGGLAAGAALYAIASGKDGFDRVGHMAANGYGAHSPAGYSMTAVLIAEALLTAVFLYVIMGATDGRAPKGFAPIAIGLALTLIHLISIPISNTSVNPARSTAVAFFNGDGAPAQLWLFWVAPIIGAIIAGATYALFAGNETDIAGEVSHTDRDRVTA